MVVLYISCAVDPQSNTPSDSYSAASHFRGVTDWAIRGRITRSGWTTGNPGGSIRICCSCVSGPNPTGLRAWPRGARAGTTLTRLHTLCTGPATASPTADSPGYIPESDSDEDPKDNDEDPHEDPADYPADHNDDEEEEEPYGDDANE
nr:hypothetical protein [Tanacetum cinerariifolium]